MKLKLKHGAEYICELDLWDEPTYYPTEELIRCKDCKHRPIRLEEDEDEKGFNLKFPDERCPCYCDDGYYNWMPSDDWYCGNGERKEE